MSAILSEGALDAIWPHLHLQPYTKKGFSDVSFGLVRSRAPHPGPCTAALHRPVS